MFGTTFVRTSAVTAMIVLAQSASAQQAEPPARLHSLTVGVTQLTSNGYSSTGWGASYFDATGPVFFLGDFSSFTENGTSSFTSVVAIGWALGPFKNKEAVAKDPRNKHVAFGPAAGFYSSVTDGGSDTKPFAGAVVAARLFGPVASRITYGFVFSEGSTPMYVNIGLGISW
jgi:hypothetical protein